MIATQGRRLGGRVIFDDGSSRTFRHVLSLIFTIPDGAESIPQNVNEWPLEYDPGGRSRSAPLAWVRAIEVLAGERRGAYRCLFDPEVEVTTVTGVSFRARYATLEWIKLASAAPGGAGNQETNDEGADERVEIVYFAGEDGRWIRRIDFD